MVQVCAGHKKEVQDGCTYELVETGINTNNEGIALGDTGIYLKDSKCVVCIKLRNLHELVASVGREMKSLELIQYFDNELRKEIFSILCRRVDFKIREY
jgi:hypothetical protein